MNTLSLLQGLRYIDTFFPSGGFAFSTGLEAAVSEGTVRTSEDFHRYVTDYLSQGVCTCEAVALARTHRATSLGRLGEVITADEELDSMKLCRPTRAASRQMGRSILHIAAQQPPGENMLGLYGQEVRENRSPGHVGVVMGVMLGELGWSQQDAIAAFLYQIAVGFVSASYKLLPIGPWEGQHLLNTWTPLLQNFSTTINADGPMTSWTPIQDIYAMRQARLPTRLFRS